MKLAIHDNLNMVMQKELNTIKDLLADLLKYMESENSNKENKTHKTIENILTEVFNLLFDCNLKSTGYTGKNYPIIILADSEKKILITIHNDAEKIKETLVRIKTLKHYLKYDVRYIFIGKEKTDCSLTQEQIDRITKPEYDFPAKNIIDITDICTLLGRV